MTSPSPFPLSYTNFVLSKESPPRPLSTEEVRLSHVAFGVATEVLELSLSQTRENTLEELGDLLWYLTLGDDVLRCLPPLPEKIEEEVPLRPLTKDILVESAEGFVSAVKRVIIYGLDEREKVQATFTVLYFAFLLHCDACEVTVDHLIESNKEKLSKRYNKSFTKEEATTRKDKE